MIFKGDAAFVCFVADVESNWPGNLPQRALRICDFYTKDNGNWIQSGSYTDAHPDSAAAQMAAPRQFSEPMKKRLLDAREAVWRAYFAGDRATLEKLIPDETIAINAHECHPESFAASRPKSAFGRVTAGVQNRRRFVDRSRSNCCRGKSKLGQPAW